MARFYRGMLVELPLQLWALPGAAEPRDLHAALADAYAGRPLVEVAGLEEAAALKTLDAELLAGTNRMKLFVFANEERRRRGWWRLLDNLGKGAGGAAVQNLNIMLGLPETTGSCLYASGCLIYKRSWRGYGFAYCWWWRWAWRAWPG